MSEHSMLVHGRIIEEQKNYYSVDTCDGIVRAYLKGKVKNQQRRLLVGDRVAVEIFNTDPREGIIRLLEKRTNQFVKPAVANIDQLFCVCTYREPALDLVFLDQFLFNAQHLGFTTILIFNKTDLLEQHDVKQLDLLLSYYHDLGYNSLKTSAVTNKNINNVIEYGKDKVSIFAGPSGVGKSTIMAAIFPLVEFRVDELSEHTARGKHTTTHTTLLKLDNNGYIADTPGFSYIELPIVPSENVASYFPEILAAEGSCKYNNCAHISEPDCVIKEMLVSGEILQSRYDAYVRIFNAMKEKNRSY